MKIRNGFESLLIDDSGATLVEYGLLLSLIAIVCIAAITFLSGKIQTMFSTMGSDL